MAAGRPFLVTTISSSRSETPVTNSGRRALTSEIGRVLDMGARETPEGGRLIGAGESHRVGKGDVVIIPPNAPHMYKNIEEPFGYLVVQTP